MAKGELIFEAKDLVKHFGPTVALNHVDFKVYRGQITGLIGENGSGKSTITSIAAGMQPATSGEMFFKGQPHKPSTMIEGAKLGIGMIVQEQGTVSGISVAQNIFLGEEKMFATAGLVSKRKMNAAAKKALENIGFTGIDPSMPIDALNMQDRKLVEIAKTVYNNPEMLVVDETTTALSQQGRDIIYNIMRKMRDENKAIVFISHDLEELMEVCDTLTVLRDGKTISSHNINDLTTDEIIAKMVGRKMDKVYPVKNAEIGEALFEVKNLTSDKFKDVSFTLHKGEILGMAGLVGAGRTEVARAIFGLDPYSSGSMILNGKEVKVKKVKDAIQEGIIYLSEDRKLEGLVLIRSICENIGLANLKRYKGFLLNKKKERKEAEEMREKLRIKTPSVDNPAQSLSGGNQQKVVIAKWLLQDPVVFIMDEPTRGIDVGAKYEIYKIMCDLAEQGAGVIMISSELPEIIGICDRTLVMSEGRIKGEVMRPEFSQERIMSYALGGESENG